MHKLAADSKLWRIFNWQNLVRNCWHELATKLNFSILNLGMSKKNWHLFGWNPKSSLPSKTANDLVKKIGMPTFW